MALNAYQQAVVDWAVSGTGHANVNALAGTGKTYTLEAIVATRRNKDLRERYLKEQYQNRHW